MIRNEHVLYGLEKHREIIDEIISKIDAQADNFDIRLMLTEALTNAFKHGNKNSLDKPIYLRYVYNGTGVIFEIEDCGVGMGDVIIPEKISEENLVDDHGRGLFIIKSIADIIEFRNNTLMSSDRSSLI